MSQEMHDRISPPCPHEMIMNSSDAFAGLTLAAKIAQERKDRQTGIGHLVVALTVSPDAGDLLNNAGFNLESGMDALRQLRGRNFLRRKSKEVPNATDDLKNVMDRTALNNLVLTSGAGKITSLNLLDAILKSSYSGVGVRSERILGRNSREFSWDNEGRQVLKIVGVDLEELTETVSQKTIAQYYPQNPTS